MFEYYIFDLPPEIILHIFDFLENKDWLALQLSCKYLYNLSGDKSKRFHFFYEEQGQK